MRHCCAGTPGGSSRRDFFRRTLLAAAAVGLSAAPAVARGHCDVLLLTCMDYRLQNEIPAYMDSRGLKDDYDHIVLAGASLGAVDEGHKAWNAVFWDHLDAAMKLHNISKVMVLDHKDCGAYRLFLGEEAVKTPELELRAHALQLRRLAGQLLAKYPHLEVELGLMGLDGAVQTVEVGAGLAAHAPTRGAAGAHAAPAHAARKASPPV